MQNPKKTRFLAVVSWLALLVSPTLPASDARADRWVALFYHIHTNYSDEELDWATPIKLSVKQVLQRADGFAKSIEMPAAVAITDHNNWLAIADPAFRPTGNVRPIEGMEWAVELGEITLLGHFDKKLRDSLKRFDSTATFMKAVDQIHAQNGIVTACHPRSKVPWRTEKRLGVDAIEVWNGIGWKTWDIDALDWWNRLLIEGERITAMGASDAHTVLHPIECAMNLVFAKSNAPEDVLAAVRRGRVMVLGGVNAPRIFLTADVDNDGNYETMSGDSLPKEHRDAVRFQVTVKKADANARLILIDRNGAFFNGPIGAGKGWTKNTYRFERSFPHGQTNFVRAEVRRQDGKTMESLCNPIYVVDVTKASRQNKLTNLKVVGTLRVP